MLLLSQDRIAAPYISNTGRLYVLPVGQVAPHESIEPRAVVRSVQSNIAY